MARRQYGGGRTFRQRALLYKRDAQIVRARFRGEAHVEGFIGSLRIGPAFGVPIHVSAIRCRWTLPADIKPRYPGAIEKNINLLVSADGSNPRGGKAPS